MRKLFAKKEYLKNAGGPAPTSVGSGGFTLVELLLYVAVSSIILFVLSGFLMIMLQARVKNQTISEVEQQGAVVMKQIMQTVQNATSIVSPSAGATSSALTLDVLDGFKTPTVFSSLGGSLQMSEGPISYSTVAFVQSNFDKVSSPAITFVQSNFDKVSSPAITFAQSNVDQPVTQTIAFVQSEFNAASAPVILPSSATNGNLIVVGVETYNQTIGANAITDNYGNTYTRVMERVVNLNHIAIFYAKNITGGSNFTVSSNINNRTLAVHEYSGADPTNPLDQFNSNFNAANNTRALNSGNVTTTTNGELYFGVGFGGRNNNSWTVGAGYTMREQVTTPLNSRIATEDKIGAAQTTAVTFTTQQNNPWAAAIATFKPAVVSSPVILPSPATDGNLIVVGIETYNEAIPADAITDNYGNTYTKVNEAVNGLNRVAIFYAKNIAGGATFTVSSLNINNRTLTVQEYSGADPTNPLDQFNSNTGSSNAPNSGNVTTTTDGELYFGLAFGGLNNNTWTAGVNYTIREQVTTPLTARIATEDKIEAAQTTAATFTTSGSGPWAATIATFRPAISSGLTVLTNNRVTVSNLSFQNLSRPGTPGIVSVQFTVNSINPENRQEFNFSKTFYGSMSIR